MKRKINISEVQTDSGLQPRLQLDFVTYTQYAQDMKDGVSFPKIKVMWDGVNYWLWDGYHRLKAAELVGVEELPVEITNGSYRDAQLASFGANSAHGLPRKPEDKRRVVTAMLEDDEWSQWSDREIARRCEVSNRFVSNLRENHTVNVHSMKKLKKFIHPKTGTTSTMDTTNIGQKREGSKPQIELFPPVKGKIPDAPIIPKISDYKRSPPESPPPQGNYKLDNKTATDQDTTVFKPFDHCQTPPYALPPILKYISNKGGVIWEPARGEGLIVKALEDEGYFVTSSCITTNQNFFEYAPEAWDIIITNPPYSIKYQWLERCYQLGKPFALLLPLETLGAKTGQELFKTHGMELILLSRRINFKMPNKGWEGKGAPFPVAWFTWGLGIGKDINYEEVNYTNNE